MAHLTATSLLLPALCALALAHSLAAADIPGTSTMPASATQPAPAAESGRLAAAVQKLPEIELPDDWYTTPPPAGKVDVASRLAAIAAVAHARDPHAATLAEVTASFGNHGQPFVHTVWRNMPLQCSRCTDAGADGTFTVVSVARNASVELTAREMHDVIAHGAAFPVEKLALLHKILDPV